jgi:hypothetical protein
VHDSETGLDCIVEADGSTAYAYLIRDGAIVSSVWLYNHADYLRAATGPEAFRTAAGGQPPPNRPPFGSGGFDPIRRVDDIEISFDRRDDGTLSVVVISLRGRPHAALLPDRNVGFCVLAAANGPLASRMEIEPEGTGWKLRLI